MNWKFFLFFVWGVKICWDKRKVLIPLDRNCKFLYIVGRGVLTTFYEDILYCLCPPPFFKFCPLPPLPLLPCHLRIWCAILLNDNIDLYMSSLGTLVPEGPWYLFYATRCQFYWGLAYNVVFQWYSDLISHTHKHKNTHNILRRQ